VNWTAASAIATWVGDALIVGTVFVALVQLKNGQQAMQFDATRNLIARSLDPDFYRALQFVFKELETSLADDAYANELAETSGWNIDAQRRHRGA
jgi:hypothetical protein